MSVGVTVELEVQSAFEDRFLLATRLYGQHTRNEPGKPRLDISKREDAPCTYVIHETYRNEGGLRAHLQAEHTRQWLDTVSEFVAERPVLRRVSPIAYNVPPPLPRPSRQAVLETSTCWPSTQAEASRWRLFPGESAPAEAAHIAATPLHLPRLQIAVERLEIASARDGFLRGAPDPCFVLACYRFDGEEVEPLGRAIYRFDVGRAPCELVRRERLLDLPVLLESYPMRLGVLLLAFEENHGSDIQEAYRDLAEPESFFVWNASQAEPNPLPLAQHAGQIRPNHCDRVQLLRDGETLLDSVRDDTWVGAASGAVVFAARTEERILRCHARSLDEQNDWLAELSFRFSAERD